MNHKVTTEIWTRKTIKIDGEQLNRMLQGAGYDLSNVQTITGQGSMGEYGLDGLVLVLHDHYVRTDPPENS